MTVALPLDGLVALARHLGYGASPGSSIDAGELVRGQGLDVQKPVLLSVDMPAKGELLGNQPASLAGGHAPRAAGLASCEISDDKRDLPAAPAGVPSDEGELRRALTKARCRAEGAVVQDKAPTDALGGDEAEGDTKDDGNQHGRLSASLACDRPGLGHVEVAVEVAGDLEGSWIMPDLFADGPGVGVGDATSSPRPFGT